MNIDFQIGLNAISSYRRLAYTAWHAIAEFIDNSTQSYINNRDALAAAYEVEGKTLDIGIVYNRDDSTFSIADNAMGMDLDDLTTALRVGIPPANPNGRSKYGLGMKTAACWIGEKWTVRTTKLGEPVEYSVTIDVRKIEAGDGWKPFYRGRAPNDLRPFFGLPPTTWHLLRNVAEQQWIKARKALSFRARRREKIAILSFLIALRGRWHADAEIEVAERSGLQTDEVIRLHKIAKAAGWISERGRITDSGRKLLKAGTKPAKKTPKMLAGPIEPYYPTSLRVS